MLPGIVDTATKGVLSKLASSIDDPVLRAAGIYLFKNVLGEGIEGGLQSTADTLAQRATYNPGAELDWGRVGSDVMRSAALGGLYSFGEFGANLNSYADAKPSASADAAADIDWNSAVNNAPLTEADIADALGVELGKASVDSLADMAYNGRGKTTEGAGNVLKNANYAQSTYRPIFSIEGQSIYSDIAGVPIKTVDDLAIALRKGLIKPSDVPIDYIVRDGNFLILNTRSSHALTQAGIPRSQWNIVNRTGVDMYESMLTNQLKNNGLTSIGTPTAKMTGGH